MAWMKAHKGDGAFEAIELDGVRTVFVQGICGSAMAGVALILKEMGKEVLGSDRKPGPPMRTLLDIHGIEIRQGYDPNHLLPEPDLVITGNVIEKDNPEAEAVREKGLPYLSFPEFLEQVVMSRRDNIVVAGTHGKTSSTLLAASLMNFSDSDTGFLAGGISREHGVSARLGTGNWFAVEGDEYETAYFARHPKFYHYPARGILLTSVEYDHSDLYPDEETYREPFISFSAKQSADSLMLVHEDVPISGQLKKKYPGTFMTYGRGEFNDWRLVSWQPEWHLVTLQNGKEKYTFQTPLPGLHNALNVTGVFGLLKELGFTVPRLTEAVRNFQGVKRRQEIVYSSPDIVVVDDFAHHPTAVALTVEAFREEYAGHELVAVFEPRTRTSRTRKFQNDYIRSLRWADRVYLMESEVLNSVPEDVRFDCTSVVRALTEHGVKARVSRFTDPVEKQIVRECEKPAVILCMSNGPMDDLPERLVAAARAGYEIEAG